MSKFSMILVAVILFCGVIGCEAASRDLIQQVFLSRKLSHRLAECLIAGLALIVLLVFAPRKLLCLIPLAMFALYAIVCFGLRETVQRMESDECKKESANHRIWETTLCTAISIFTAVGIGLFACLVLASLAGTGVQSSVSEEERMICCCLLIGVLSLLLATLVHFLVMLRLHPSSGDNPSCTLLQLRRTLRIPHRI